MGGFELLGDLLEATGGLRLKATIRNKIGGEIHDICKGLLDTIPMDEIFDVLDKYGVVPLQEDNTKWSGLISAPTGKQTNFKIELGDKSTGRDLHGEQVYEPYVNAVLVFSVLKFETGRYEVVCYVG